MYKIVLMTNNEYENHIKHLDELTKLTLMQKGI